MRIRIDILDADDEANRKGLKEHTQRRLALPTWAHVPEKCGLHEVLPADCLEQVDRFMAARSLVSRLDLMQMECDDDDIKSLFRHSAGLRGLFPPPGFPPDLDCVFHLVDVCAKALLYDKHDNRRHGLGVFGPCILTHFVANTDEFLMGPAIGKPHLNTYPERQRMGRSCGWIFVTPSQRRTGNTVGLRLADALDLADPWTTRGHPGVHLRYGGDSHRRDKFKNWNFCTEWWASLITNDDDREWWGADTAAYKKVQRLVDRADAIKKARPRGLLKWRNSGVPGPG